MTITACPFCHSEGGNLIWQDALCRVVLADEPDYPGFCRVITHRHVKEMTDLTTAEQWHLLQVVLNVEGVMRDTLSPDKINLASLGNMTPHLHWHIIPRYHDDTHFPAPIWAVAPKGRQAHRQTPEALMAFANTLKARLFDSKAHPMPDGKDDFVS